MAVKGAGRRVEVGEDDRVELERIVRAPGSEVRMVVRAQIVLCAGEGLTGQQIAERVGCSLPTVVNWRGRYGHDEIAGLGDAPRSGAVDVWRELRARLIAKACTRPQPTARGARRERWTYSELRVAVKWTYQGKLLEA